MRHFRVIEVKTSYCTSYEVQRRGWLFWSTISFRDYKGRIRKYFYSKEDALNQMEAAYEKERIDAIPVDNKTYIRVVATTEDRDTES